ncbi:hypothetical protein [Anoxybacteroides tepidamans]|uniref:hypothetical protein n=1 Tax=Anoxybacteroides tepidamans TaxID=265948 RepID=UPI000487C360|nr:hypothetical protein [Anoxybacillus tepidamans]
MKKKRVLFTTFIISLVIIFGVVFMFFSKTLSPNSIAISEANVGDKIISIKGSIAESGTKYKGYSISEKNGTLFINIKGSLFPFGGKGSSFDIQINKNEYAHINKILLYDGTHNRQIWPEK